MKNIKKRFNDYLERLIVINEREFGHGSLSLLTFNKINKRSGKLNSFYKHLF
ncbi:MAG: hypothetical protein OCD02_10080 [Spirochaetaceae bacterium]